MTTERNRPGKTEAAPQADPRHTDQANTDSNGSDRHAPAGTKLRVPNIDPDADILTAALAYANASGYVLPVRRGTKDPGSVVGKRWQNKSSRDPKTITAWFAGTDHGIALHCGRSGAVVFDVDNPDKLPELLHKHLQEAPFQSTRPDVPGRGHYVFAMPPGRTIGNSVGRLGGGWGEVRGINGVIIVMPTPHIDGGRYGWESTGSVPELPAELADMLDEASPTLDAATDTLVSAFINDHQTCTRPEVLQGLVSALHKEFDAGESRHHSTLSVLTGAMKEAGIGLYPAQAAIDAIKPMFLEAVVKPPASGKQGAARNGPVAESEFNGILALAVGQALGADLNQVRARVDEKMPDTVKSVNTTGDQSASEDDDEAVQTIPWPTLSAAALRGPAGEIVKLVTPHTEADPAAILVQLLAVFGATVGSRPHFIAGNDCHQAIIHPLVVGRTNNGAKGTALALVEAIRREALPEFDANTVSGLSSAEGLIEMVRDATGDDPDADDYDPGVTDKRLLVRESEYKSVLVRMRRDGNTLGQTIRDSWDCRTLRTLTRKHNRLTATQPHIVIIGHITPREFRATLDASDLSGGTVNRLLICLSRRSRLHSRLGNLPEDVLKAAAAKFDAAHDMAYQRGELTFTTEFWKRWDDAYLELNRDRPDCDATDATARGVITVLRLALLYALFDGAATIGVDHLDAALALWRYCEHSARWLFSNHQLEQQRETSSELARFVREGGVDGRTRTEINRDYFKGNKSASEINDELAPLVHDGVLVEMKDKIGTRPTRRYIHRSQRTDELTNYAGPLPNSATIPTNPERTHPDRDATIQRHSSWESVDDSSYETSSHLHNSSNSLVRRPEGTGSVAPPGELKPGSPGQTERMWQAVARAKNNGQNDTHLGADDTTQPQHPDGER